MPDVDRVVLIYLNHGNPRWLGVVANELFTQTDFRGWAEMALACGRRLLVVLDCCHSTMFAEEVWRRLSIGRPGSRHGALGDAVCFLTSGRGTCYNSVNVVSRDPSLVYHEYPAIRHRPFAAGYRRHNSMFTRQLNWLIGYGGVGRLTLARFPGQMNGTIGHRQGFFAALVGGSFRFHDLRISVFFGNLALDPTQRIPGAGMTVGHVLPDAAMGRLYDDLCCFCRGVWDLESASHTCVEIARDPHRPGGVRVVSTVELSGDRREGAAMLEALGGRDGGESGEVQRRSFVGSRRAQAGPQPAVRSLVGRVRDALGGSPIPITLLFERFRDLALAEGLVGVEWEPLGEKLEELKDVLGVGDTEIMSRIEWTSFHNMGKYGAASWQRTRFERVLRRAADDIIERRWGAR
jgi:hypothetical protein